MRSIVLAPLLIASVLILSSCGGSSDTPRTKPPNQPPRVITTYSKMLAVTGVPLTLSAGLSFDDDGQTLSYAWTLKSKPADSVAALSGTTSDIAFSPDKAGLYVATVSVSDGADSSSADIVIRARTDNALAAIELPFNPIEASYSKSLESVILIASEPNTLRTVDLTTNTIKSVLLPLPPKAMAVSPNGKHAAVAYDGSASLIDLQTSTIIKTVEIAGSPSDIFLTDSDQAYAAGSFSGVYSGMVRLDFPAGMVDSTPTSGSLLTSQSLGTLADKKNKIFLGQPYSGYGAFNIVSYSAGTGGQIQSISFSPYYYDSYYTVCGSMWTDESQDNLFTACGAYFKTADGTYGGLLGGISEYADRIVHISHSQAEDELLVLVRKRGELPSAYLRYSGPLFSPAPSVAVPRADGRASYASSVFHSQDSNTLVFVVQTDSTEPRSAMARYYVVTQ